MPKKAMVTRTITTTKVEVMCLDIAQQEPYNDVVILPRTYKDEKTLLKAAAARIDDDTHKAVHIVRHEVLETLYGMDEATFVSLAQELEPRKTKTDNCNTDTYDTDTDNTNN